MEDPRPTTPTVRSRVEGAVVAAANAVQAAQAAVQASRAAAREEENEDRER